MAKNCPDRNPLQHNGSSQSERFLSALDPSSAPPMDLGIKEWMRFAYQYAKELNYFGLTDHERPEDDWENFFVEEGNIDAFYQQISKDNNTEPHLALFICFLRLLEHSKEHLNTIPGRHLNLYYKDILQLRERPATPDKVHLIFELAKNATEQRITTDTLFNGDKDKDGKIRWFASQEELIASTAKVEQIQHIYHQKDQNLFYAPVANSSDGLGAELPKDNPTWFPFGHPELPKATIGFSLASSVLKLKEGTRTIKANLQLRNFFGQIEKNDILNHIQIFLTGEKGWIGPFRPIEKGPNDESITSFIPPDTSKISRPIQNLNIQSLDRNIISGLSEFSTLAQISSAATTAQINIGIQLDTEQEAIVNYQSAVHGLRYNTNHPVMRILFIPDNNSPSKAYQLYSSLQNAQLKSSTVEVEVQGMKEIIVENDQGRVDASKAFLPFGPQPVVGSNFYIGNPEIFAKDWTELSVNLNWQDLPENLQDYYRAYQRNFIQDLTKGTYPIRLQSEATTPPTSEISAQNIRAVDLDLLKGNLLKEQFQRPFNNSGVLLNDFNVESTSQAIVTTNGYFQADVEVLKKKEWEETNQLDLKLFETPARPDGNANSTLDFKVTNIPDAPDATDSLYLNNINSPYFHTRKAIIDSYIAKEERKAIFDNSLFKVEAKETIDNNQLSTRSQKGFIRLQLDQHFFHKVYPQLYAVAISKEEDSNALIPNEPYTPKVSSIELSYKAKAEDVYFFTSDDSTARMDKLLKFERKAVQFFHEHPFGQQEQHPFLKQQYNFIKASEQAIRLLPNLPWGGDLYLGIKDAKSLSTLSLLIQVAEGSENPLAPSFEGEDGITWSALCSNEWKPLDKEYKILDTTNDFLESGIVKFLIPAEATTNNTIQAPELTWLKASIRDPYIYSSVCKVMGIHAQVLTAEFQNQENELSHLETALPAETISKMQERQALIKKITQPYNSFDGATEESTIAFYRRVSERLRHKKRAVNIWDYEHLVLEKFPSIYKVKCLNHTATVDPRITNPIDPRKLGSELAPGFVSVIVIPDIRNKNAFDTLQPRVSKNILTKIEDYLLDLHSMHVEFNAANPDYESVRLEFEVVMKTGFDPNFYSKELDQELVNFLSPWAGNNEANIEFGGTVHRSMLINFIEKRPYVDFVADFAMKHYLANEPLTLSKPPLRTIQASNSKAILGSAPSHIISVVKAESCPR